MGKYDKIFTYTPYGTGVRIGEGGGCMPMPFAASAVDTIVMTVQGQSRTKHPQMLIGGCQNGSEYIGACSASSEFYHGGYVTSVTLSNTADQTFDNTINTITISNLTVTAGYFILGMWGFGYYGTTNQNNYWFNYVLFDVKFYKSGVLYAHYDFEDIVGTSGDSRVTILDKSGNGRLATLNTYIPTQPNPYCIYTNNTQYKQGTPVRYIKIGSTGNSVNTGNHLVECKVFDTNGTNIALNKTVTNSNGNNASYPLSRIVDGIVDTYSYAELGADANGSSVTTIDLGAEYTNIKEIALWRYYLDSRTYHNTFLKGYDASDNLTITFHDSAVTGEYPETVVGKTFGTISLYPDSDSATDSNPRQLYVGTPSGIKKATKNKGTATASQTFNSINCGTYFYYNGWNYVGAGQTPAQGTYNYNGGGSALYVFDRTAITNWLAGYLNPTATNITVTMTRTNASGMVDGSIGYLYLSDNTALSGGAPNLANGSDTHVQSNTTNNTTEDGHAMVTATAWSRNTSKTFTLPSQYTRNIFINGWATAVLWSSYRYDQGTTGQYRYFRLLDTASCTITISYETWT